MIYSKEHLDQIINAVADPIFVKDRDHRWVLLNDANCKKLGRSRKELLGKSDYDFFPKHEADVFWKKDELVFKTGQENINEEEFTDSEGNTSTIVTKKTLFKDSNGNKFIIGVIRDITKRKMMERKLIQTLKKVKSLSLTDDLTKLYNRRGFITLGQQQLKLADRTKAKLVLIYADMDGLKKINDKLGHHLGDKALVQVAKIFKATFRESDIVGRIGGDEFVVLAIAATRHDADLFNSTIEQKLKKFNGSKKAPFTLSLSIGIAQYHRDFPCSIEELLERADRIMYRNKKRKRRRD